ncbi:MAG: GtrA family protein [Firmicutes bacterium]|nr:GtrA family protein [Bacillota bacterium]
MNKLIKQILKFGIVGGIAFVIDYGIFALLTSFNLHYLWAQVISFTVALAFNYLASIKWVFDAKRQTPKEIIIFIVLSVVGLGINELLLFIGVDKMNYHELIVKLVSTIIVMIYNFITRKLIVEKHS